MSDERDDERSDPPGAQDEEPGKGPVRPESFSSPGGRTEIVVGSGEEPHDVEEVVDLPEELPILPLKNTVLYPYLVSPLLVNTPRSRSLIDEVLVRPDRLLVCSAVKHPVEGSPGPDDVYRVGTVLRVAKMIKFPDESYRLLVQGVARVTIEDFVSSDPFLRGRIRVREDAGDLESVETTALMRNVSQQFASLVSESPRLSGELQVLALNLEDPSKLADLVASNLDFDVAGKQEVLSATSVPERLKVVLAQLNRQSDALEIETEIKEKVQTEMGRTQRDYMLRQQLEAIRKELGEAEDDKAEMERLKERIEAAGMSEEGAKQANRELERMSQTPPAAAEYSVIRTYLEWMTEVPWSKTSEDRLDVAEARRILDEDHYGLEKVKDRIVEFIAVLSLKRELKGPILCFVGPPGTGKTSLGRSIARALGREFARISLGGVRDEAEIRGHRRTYVGALPGRFIQSLRKAGTRNPVIVLDELDKVGADGRGDPSSALLEVLDPEQNIEFSDHYIEVPFDLSQVLFIATANLMDPVPAALRDRMEVIELPGYTLEEKVEIAKRFLVPRQVAQNGIAEVDFELPDETLHVLCESYTREAGVRNLEREIGGVCRKIARRVAEGEVSGPLRVAPEELFDLLGPVKFEPDLAEQGVQAGVAVGLAWTPAGGDILFIESAAMPGKGELKLTGSLGDVMRESVEAARSWLRTHAADFDLEVENFESRDIHVHVPSGAVPKDGPSAGVGMVTSLASLFTGKPVTPKVAMTGEITLRGKVLPVGGIKEKLLAAKRSGIECVVLPERNRKDADEIPENLLKGLELRYVGTIDEALQHTLATTASAV
ncbi:MAG: endopeptidase La [Deltaproteobacteria bacterium]|nr:endopeptidase La [Deltaproteobacteria bacterium]MBW2418503.1 endopeptidase La [Deltaproteobacteria bacterium]